MKQHVRDHIKRYWHFAYRRAIGASILTIAIAIAIGALFEIGFAEISSSISYILMLVLGLFTTVVILLNFANAHLLSVRHMTKEEHEVHNRYMLAWFSILLAGIAIFALPFLLFGNAASITLYLFMVGGIFWIIYLSTALLFDSYYHEMAFGASILWIMFGFVMLAPPIASALQNSVNEQITIIMLIAVLGIIGGMMLFSSAREFSIEFEKLAQEEDKKLQRGNVKQMKKSKGRK